MTRRCTAGGDPTSPALRTLKTTARSLGVRLPQGGPGGEPSLDADDRGVRTVPSETPQCCARTRWKRWSERRRRPSSRQACPPAPGGLGRHLRARRGEVDRLGAGRRPAPGTSRQPRPSRFLMASTSEVESRASVRPALELRHALEDRGLRVYNPRNKTAGRPGSPVHDLLALVSYLIDPVTHGARRQKRPDHRSLGLRSPDRSTVRPRPHHRSSGSPRRTRVSRSDTSRPRAASEHRVPMSSPALDYIDDIR